MKPANTIPQANAPIPGVEIIERPLMHEEIFALSGDEGLMPYGLAAKAIFVKANGLPAYERSIRFVRHAD
jgi:hypothetical protein